MRFKAILFDLDGTLIETIHLYSRACIQTLKDRGVTVTPAEFREIYTSGARIEDVFKKYGGDETRLENLRPHRDENYINLLRSHAAYLPGAEDLLASTKHIPRAIVTGSWQTYVDAIHEKLGILDHFAHTIAADHTHPFHKPHPHGFLLAADRLQVEPKDCLVVGDQLFDIDAAEAAGMTSCLVWTDFTPKHAVGRADKEVANLSELQRYLHP